MYGILEYDENGNPKCEICGCHFVRVLTHVRQKHDMNEKEYKRQFGFDMTKGICNKASSERSRQKVYDNYTKCIEGNLVKGGVKTRYNKGDPGRTRDKLSEQTLIALKERLKSPKMVEAMKESGYRVGKSGLGNKKRWHNDE